TYVGGIVGYNAGTITNVFNEAVVVGKTSSVGGICGYMAEASVLSNAYSNNQTFAPEKSGTLVGELYGQVENAYSYGVSVIEENRIKLFGIKSASAKTDSVNVWIGSALVEDFTEVTTENYAQVVSALNQKAAEKDWYKWSINSQKGNPQFVTKIIWDGNPDIEFDGGDGSKEKPYLISNAAQLANFAIVAVVETYAKLTNDIYLNDETFEFIPDSGLVKVTDGKNVAYFGTGVKGLSGGENTKFDNVPSTRGVWYKDDQGTEGTYKGTLNTWTAVENLKGNFDGNGFTIYGMYSLSSFIDSMTGDLKNLTIANSLTYNQTTSAGFVQTFNGGNIENCVNLGIVIGGDTAGIVGKVTSDITTTKDHKEEGYTSIYVVKRTSIINSKNLGVLIGINVGGIVGYGEFIEKIENCFNVGQINATNKAAGIIYAYNGRYEEMGKTFTISNCHNYAEITGKDYTAGIIANLVGGQEKVEDKSTYKPSKILISNVSNSSSITGSAYAAGIIAYADKQSAEEIKIENATNSGDIIGLNYTGGVAGRINYGVLSNATNAGNIQGVTSTGGIVGYGAVSITEAENTGIVSGLNNVGGIVGYLYDANYLAKNVYNFANVTGTSLVGGVVGKLTSNANIESAYTSGNVAGAHSVGGIVGEADSGSIKQAYTASIVEGDYYIGGIVGNQVGNVTYIDAFYPYGLVTASSCAEKEQTGVGVTINALSSEEPNGVSKYSHDMALCVKGSVQVDDINAFLTTAKVEEQGAKMFVIDNKDNYCMLDGQIIIPANYGLSPSSGKSILLVYKAKATVTLYANGQGEILGGENGWAVTYQGQTASKVLYANSPIGEMPMMYDDFYTFDGWYVDSECLGQKVTSASVYDFSYTKLYAKWIIETFTITIDTTGLCEIPETSGWWLSDDKYSATKHLTSLDAVGKLPVLEVEGYTFEGWFIDPEFNYRISPSSLFWAREDTTMYPLLTPNTLELSIRLNDVEWLNSNINIGVYKVVDSTETLVWTMENITESSVKVDKALEKGFYKVYASRKADKLTELYQIGAVTYVEGMVNFVIDYYSLTLTRGDIGINSVYISEENEVYINGQDIHNNAQI
ncbi:MAG: InlB B-repeat-containing protein, partial [Clostridia bacterium]|nr:InlB B-repeat-containing protein [Clostridia bacterium]